MLLCRDPRPAPEALIVDLPSASFMRPQVPPLRLEVVMCPPHSDRAWMSRHYGPMIDHSTLSSPAERLLLWPRRWQK